jgi:hypothetical protein
MFINGGHMVHKLDNLENVATPGKAVTQVCADAIRVFLVDTLKLNIKLRSNSA